ncbi:hypothetical protein NW752_008515 [Fusarium irregulare]|uniref:C6 zinc finger domain protein n=1 Tax=Fusarium irregulare TaxID=2494466 RepID=A0A9W8PX06_9HYPO|nr:hypothetical protein NW752_008515 [Fusarium irregulare]KAJ4020447.1 hypothetical protein NW766_001931 [Fusarium irregulare]
MTHAEPAARHAVLAISQLFEDFEYSNPETDRFAIMHYNKAIHQLVQGPPASVDTVLLVCILFICVEFLRGNRAAAITHARHGLHLLNSAGHNSRLTNTYHQISVLPTFLMDESVGCPLEKSTKEGGDFIFSSTNEAQHAMDDLCFRGVRVIRAGSPYRLETPFEDPPQEVYDAQANVLRDLASWKKAFDKLQCTRPPAVREDSAALALMARHYSIRMFVRECLIKDEMCFDDNKDEFLATLTWARKTAEILETQRKRPTRFIFETGFNTMLHVMVYKCRYLPLRLEGLALMRRLSSERESLWDTTVVYSLSRRIVEVEHGIDLSGDYDANDATLPPSSKRIKGFSFWGKREALVWDASSRKTIDFIMESPDGGCMLRNEWLTRQTDKSDWQPTVTRGCPRGQGTYLPV